MTSLAEDSRLGRALTRKYGTGRAAQLAVMKKLGLDQSLLEPEEDRALKRTTYKARDEDPDEELLPGLSGEELRALLQAIAKGMRGHVGLSTGHSTGFLGLAGAVLGCPHTYWLGCGRTTPVGSAIDAGAP